LNRDLANRLLENQLFGALWDVQDDWK